MYHIFITNQIIKINYLIQLFPYYQVFRHGPRTPADTYPTDEYINEQFFPYGWGQLTNEGKEFMFESGEWLKERYGKFLSYYQPDVSKKKKLKIYHNIHFPKIQF